jgi:hypothetical protein
LSSLAAAVVVALLQIVMAARLAVALAVIELLLERPVEVLLLKVL